MEASRLGVGVVGINTRIRRAVLAGIAGSRRARLAAVCSRDPAKAANVTQELGGAAYASYSDLLADTNVDVVFIATPHALHYSMARAALEAGKSVICEKPLTLTVADAKALATQARESEVRTAVNFTYHSLPGQHYVARLLSSNTIGQLLHLDITYLQARQRFAGAMPTDAILDVGSHQIDLATWWCDLAGAGAIATVVAQVDQTPGGDVPIWTALARTTTGAQICLQADRIAAGYRNGMICRAFGSEGAIQLNFDTDSFDVSVARFGDGSPEGVFRPAPIPTDLDVSYSQFPAFHIDQLIGAISGDVEFPDFEYGVRIQRVIGAMQRSVVERRWVDVTVQ